MNNAQEQFFSLLRAGLWGSPINEGLFSRDIYWDEILKMADMQTVNGILFDGIAKLPSEKQPPVLLMRKLYQTIIRIERSHELLNKTLEKIVPALQEEGIHPILLKGQGVAQNYPNPVRRQCGDIDLYVGEKNCKKAADVSLLIGAIPEEKTKRESPKHKNFYLGEVSLELHFLVEKLHNPIYNLKFQRWTTLHLSGSELRRWNINNFNIILPPINFDALYIFNHLFHHFIAGGVGLRQLCDWMLYLHKFKNQINKEELLHDLKSFGLLRAWQIFGNILVDVLGLAKDDFPFYVDRYTETAEKILQKVLEVGNFGFYNSKRGQRPAGYLSGKFHSLLFRQKWLLSIFPTLPKEVFTFYIWYWYDGTKNIIKGW